jgi:hypothetical protein
MLAKGEQRRFFCGFYAFGYLQQQAKKKLLPENRMSGIMLIFAVEKQQCKEPIL